MKTYLRYFQPLLLMGIVMIGASAGLAHGGRAAERAIEVAELHISPGPSARVRAVGCPSCPRSFELADDYQLFVDGEPLERDRWPEQQGKIGTLIYNSESGQAVRLRW